jgi:hypothetical protein
MARLGSSRPAGSRVQKSDADFGPCNSRERGSFRVSKRRGKRAEASSELNRVYKGFGIRNRQKLTPALRERCWWTSMETKVPHCWFGDLSSPNAEC